MCTKFQRFVATILLFSSLLQSCGNPNWKIANDELSRGAGAKTCNSSKVKQRSEALALATAASSPKGSMEPKVGGAPALGDASSSQRANEALAEVASEASGELASELPKVLHGDQSSPPSYPRS